MNTPSSPLHFISSLWLRLFKAGSKTPCFYCQCPDSKHAPGCVVHDPDRAHLWSRGFSRGKLGGNPLEDNSTYLCGHAKGFTEFEKKRPPPPEACKSS